MPDVTLELIQVTENDNDTFNVYIRAIREADGAEIQNKQFTVTDAADLKNQLRPRYQALLADEARKKQLETIIGAALAVLMSEVTP